MRDAPIFSKSLLIRYIPSLNDEVRPAFRVGSFSTFTLGCSILIFLSVFVLAGYLLAAYSPSAINAGPRLSSPDPTYWFGTDALGRDMFSRVIHGFLLSIGISLAAAALAAVGGITLGLFGGYYRGWVEQALSRLVDVLLSLPGLLLAIVLIARLGPSMYTLILAMGITGIPTFYRITRAETMTMSTQPFVEASRSLGLSNIQLIFLHILPNIFPTLLALISLRVGIFLLMGSGLSFIGLGVKPPQVELGALLASGKEYYQTAQWLVVFPAGAILLIVLGFNLLGEGLRDRLEL